MRRTEEGGIGVCAKKKKRRKGKIRNEDEKKERMKIDGER